MSKLKVRKSVVLHLVDYSVHTLDFKDIKDIDGYGIYKGNNIVEAIGVVEPEAKTLFVGVKKAATREIRFHPDDRLKAKLERFLSEDMPEPNQYESE